MKPVIEIEATYTQQDFLCLGPNCWGRAKSAAEALKAAKRNFPWGATAKRKAKFTVFQIADQVDGIEVDEVGSAHFYTKESVGLNAPNYCKKL